MTFINGQYKPRIGQTVRSVQQQVLTYWMQRFTPMMFCTYCTMLFIRHHASAGNRTNDQSRTTSIVAAALVW